MIPMYLSSTVPLVPSSASVLILTVKDGGYAVQLRDDKPEIWYPNHWGLFGGGIDPGETPEQALIRELDEELSFSCIGATLFTTFSFDFSQFGHGVMSRYFYELRTTRLALSAARLGEGRAMAVFDLPDLLERHPVMPYDSFALWMHYSQTRLHKTP